MLEVEVRQMATAFLIHQDRVLMMKKAKSKIFHFEFWGGIGGHMEPNELNYPMEASYREIEEETGIKKDDIKNFKLNYILLENNSGEIRQQYVYFGETRHMNVRPSDEGELYWISKNELSSLYTSKMIGLTLEHYLTHTNNTPNILLGAMMTNNESKPEIQWSIINETFGF
ncbi:NUDIX hydrolase [Pullulanibacillus sp. KACC 23026]|uniref:NUDIX domain-containing protein n=1 Tax=Pullulanibacillus sp. KACC 23026 TaxID=3028315 RepID=UPI0023B0170A|nr:NUDIX hydrolase [Pullulanibacillus sp. KACC 23026]WEG14534.1 NUDIX hydrolase [Pullulanibacillus sp. KACC 23026]